MKGYVELGFALDPTGDMTQYGNFVTETSGSAGGGGGSSTNSTPTSR